MKLKLYFKNKGDIQTDQRTIRIMQGFLYQKLSEIGATYVHEDRFVAGSKTFRHFCFSDIKKNKADNQLYSFYFATALDEIIPALCQNLYCKELYYGKQKLNCVNIEIVDSYLDLDNCPNSQTINITTLSPVVVDKTIHQPKKRRYYYSPLDDEFLAICKKNLIDKYNSIHQEQITDAEFTIHKVENCQKISKKYIKPNKNKPIEIIIKGYCFNCQLAGDPRLLQIALNSGLGSKNAQGFGFIKKI